MSVHGVWNVLHTPVQGHVPMPICLRQLLVQFLPVPEKCSFGGDGLLQSDFSVGNDGLHFSSLLCTNATSFIVVHL